MQAAKCAYTCPKLMINVISRWTKPKIQKYNKRINITIKKISI